MKFISKTFWLQKDMCTCPKTSSTIYEKMGFAVISDEYLQEGIVHVTMEMEV